MGPVFPTDQVRGLKAHGEAIYYGLVALILRRRGLWATAALGHELVEFGLVFGMTQAVEKCFELALFLFEAAQGFRAVFVKGAVAARG